MIILDLFRKKRVCRHTRVTPDAEFAYCPDCGELIENQWYLSRCACCGVKLKSVIRNNEIVPEERFCCNCGTRGHLIERLDKINFIDINFAVLVKATMPFGVRNYTQSWIEPETRINIKLIAQNN